jgi:hypothetical protein
MLTGTFRVDNLPIVSEKITVRYMFLRDWISLETHCARPHDILSTFRLGTQAREMWTSILRSNISREPLTKWKSLAGILHFFHSARSTANSARRDQEGHFTNYDLKFFSRKCTNLSHNENRISCTVWPLTRSYCATSKRRQVCQKTCFWHSLCLSRWWVFSGLSYFATLRHPTT